MSTKSTHRFRGVTRRRFLALGAATLLLGACGGSDSSTSSTETVADTAVEVPVVDDTTAPVEVAGKIVSLSPTATEMLYAIGAQDQIIAVDNYSNFPAEAAAFEPKIDAYEPSVEAIAALDPTTVLIAFDPGSLQSQLEKLGIAVWVGAPATNFDDAYRQEHPPPAVASVIGPMGGGGGDVFGGGGGGGGNARGATRRAE